jgi:hypothetical protein
VVAGRRRPQLDDRHRGQIPHTFSAWGELAVFAGYAAMLLAAGTVLFSRRGA